MTYTNTTNLQKYLKTKGFYKGALDGIFGRVSDAALTNFLADRKGKLTFIPKNAGFNRTVNAAWQLFCLEAGITEVGAIDGFRGPSTEYALTILEAIDKTGHRPAPWRDAEPTPLPLAPAVVKNNWPLQTQKEMEKYYGKMGENQTMMVPPYEHRLGWDVNTKLKQFSIHEKCHDSALRVLNRALSHYGPQRIHELRLDLWSGCLNVRSVRGGTTPSMHSWGAAIDYDGDNNQLKWGSVATSTHPAATFAKPDYKVWFDLWEEEGWISLGRTRNYDWMHVQAARLS